MAAIVLCAASSVWGQGFGSLKNVAVPPVPGLERYVRDPVALVVLGKALFWDMQVGSDGRTACATCHFHAGADHRPRNQLSNPSGVFEPNHQLVWNDFPFRVFSNPDDNRSPVLRDSSQRAGSAGTFSRTFTGLSDSGTEQALDSADASGFQIRTLNIRQVTPRNAPSVINAVFHSRAFRDGRASDVFTGRTPFGDSDPRANVLAASGDTVTPERVRLINSALASQAVAPPLNTTEMSYAGRTWPALGRKLLAMRPLGTQQVAPDDSVFGPYVNSCCRGLDPSYTYLSLVKAAFQPAYWDSRQLVDEDGHPGTPGAPNGYSIAEFNFPLFFGLAIQAYESTLVGDDTPFDRFEAGARGALTAAEISGYLAFQTRAFCQFCHSGPELTHATAGFVATHDAIDTVLTGAAGSAQFVFSDTGFFNTGVRPVTDDAGLDILDDFGVPVSLAARGSKSPLGITGAFKVPGLRNVEFTGPYFHNGGQASLEQVIDFYARGGDVPGAPALPVQIIPVPLSQSDRGALVAFLKALSDDRVRFERAPFDHPELCVPVGYDVVPAADPKFPRSAVDLWAGVPAVGRGGSPVPLQTFEELLKGTGSDGTRAHTLTEPCTIP